MRIERDGDDYVLNGRKWWITGAMHPNCKIFIVMGKTDLSAPPHRQQSQILVPMGTPGMTVVRALPVFGYLDPEGHVELLFENCRVPASNLIANDGDGFAISQARLGPGRIHHCMRSIGAAERALELFCKRALSRTTFGKRLAERSNIMDWIAESRIDLEMVRLLTLKTAWMMDNVGNKAAARRDQCDQGRRTKRRPADHRQSHAGARCRRPERRLAAGSDVRPPANPAPRRRARRGAQDDDCSPRVASPRSRLPDVRRVSCCRSAWPARRPRRDPCSTIVLS